MGAVGHSRSCRVKTSKAFRSMADIYAEEQCQCQSPFTIYGFSKLAVVPADEGDEENLALRENADFMAYLTECEQRARTRPRKSLQQIRELYGSPPAVDSQDAT